MSSGSSANNVVLPSNGHPGDTGVGHVPSGYETLSWLFGFIQFQSFMIYVGVQIGQHRGIELGTQNATHASTGASQQQNETQEAIIDSDHHIVNVEDEPPNIVNEEDEPPEAENSVLRIFFEITSISISLASTGILGFVQGQFDKNTKPALKLNYMACNVSFSASFIIAIVSWMLHCIPWNFVRRTLLLRVVIGVSVVLLMSDVGLALAFNLQRA